MDFNSKKALGFLRPRLNVDGLIKDVKLIFIKWGFFLYIGVKHF